MYQIKNFKRFKGHEGEPLAQGSLHGTNGKVAEWSDDSHGGPLHWHFTKPADETAFVAWAKTYLPTQLDYDNKPFDVSGMSDGSIVESAIQQLSYAEEQRKLVEKCCKSGIAFNLREEDGSVEMYTTASPYTPQNVALLRAKHPNLVEILNETMGLPFVDATAHALAERNKFLKRLCRNGTVFSVKQPDGTIKEMKTSQLYCTEVAKALKARHPNLVEIINERFL